MHAVLEAQVELNDANVWSALAVVVEEGGSFDVFAVDAHQVDGTGDRQAPLAERADSMLKAVLNAAENSAIFLIALEHLAVRLRFFDKVETLHRNVLDKLRVAWSHVANAADGAPNALGHERIHWQNVKVVVDAFDELERGCNVRKLGLGMEQSDNLVQRRVLLVAWPINVTRGAFSSARNAQLDRPGQLGLVIVVLFQQFGFPLGNAQPANRLATAARHQCVGNGAVAYGAHHSLVHPLAKRRSRQRILRASLTCLLASLLFASLLSGFLSISSLVSLDCGHDDDLESMRSLKLVLLK